MDGFLAYSLKVIVLVPVIMSLTLLVFLLGKVTRI